MKPAPFDYVRPKSVDEACELMSANEDARIIAGGQTLIPMLAMRLARPTLLVDVARIEEMRGIRREGDSVIFGAATRQCEAEVSALVTADLPLLAAALPWIGHQPTRSRGTIGGSIANADPSAEIPLVAATLQAEIVLREGDEEMEMPAEEFFLGAMYTAAAPEACLTAVRFPRWQGRVGVGFHEVSARRSDFAMAAAAAQVSLNPDGSLARIAVGIAGVEDHPVRLDLDHLCGLGPDADALRAALTDQIADFDAMEDLHASGDYRRRAAVELAMRAVADARTDATRRQEAK